MDPGSVAAFSNLTDDITVIIIVMLAAWVLGQFMKYRSGRKMAPDETAALERMSQTAQRMERRVAALERILDAEAPAWRATPQEDTMQQDGGNHGLTR